MITFGSVCSGIEAASVAWGSLGWKCAFVSEIEPFHCRVLAHHYPDVPNRGDLTRFQEWPDDAIDLLVGGTPCQSFSVAGLRAGMADPRGNLALVFLGLVGRARPRWVVWENVPGVLSSNGGRDFGAFLGGLGQLGYGWSYRVLDAQYFGVAQRRRRVFVVGHLGDWQRAAAVLFERSCLRGDLAPSREAGARVAGCLDGSAHGGGFDDNDARAGKCVEVAHAVACHSAKGGDPTTDNYVTRTDNRVTHSLRADGFDASEDGTGRGTPLVAATLSAGGNPNSNAPGRRKEDDYNLAVVGFHSQQDPISEPGLSLPLEAGGGQAVAFTGVETLQRQGYDGAYARTQEADAAEVLRVLQGQVGAEAFAEWRSGILDSLQAPEVLRAFLHGIGVRRAAREAGRLMGDGAPSRAEGLPEGAVRALWLDGPDGRSPQGRELAKQLARQSGKALPLLPSAGPSSLVRRLTPEECEALQGFPRHYTAIPGAKDSPRYRALGNSMAVPCMRWLGERIARVEAA